MCVLAGLAIANQEDEDLLLLTDDITQIKAAKQVIWSDLLERIPQGIKAKVDLATTPEQLRCCVKSVISGNCWGIDAEIGGQNQGRSRIRDFDFAHGGKARSRHCPTFNY